MMLKKQKKILKEYDKIAKILWLKYNFGEGTYDKVSLKKLNLKSLDRGVIITKIEDEEDLNDRKR